MGGASTDRFSIAEEMAYYERLAVLWWDTGGPFWPLHRLNALRSEYLPQAVCRALGCSGPARDCLKGIRVLDIGCGGGLLSESMARLGATVTGIDVVARNTKVAALHAETQGLNIDYRHGGVDDLHEEQFDLVLNMEVVEHVQDPAEFLRACASRVRPGRLMVVATINRTPAAWLAAIVGAEHVLRWLPRGTHRWRKFVKPAEVAAILSSDFQLTEACGVRINPLTRRFGLTSWLGINYMQIWRRSGGIQGVPPEAA